eukprot:GHVH01006580.1.p1 GENE.GHVH01006580.1~~GHVH01006580.1.p1  ORF type:complete len:234 (-),score=40.21 GHVH01006580.1:61-762(-)
MTVAAMVAEENRLDDIKWLINHGADILTLDNSRSTFLHHIVLGGSPTSLIQDHSDEEEHEYAWMVRSTNSLSYYKTEMDVSMDSIKTDPALLPVEVASLETLHYVLYVQGGALVSKITCCNSVGDNAACYFAETASSPPVLIWALRILLDKCPNLSFKNAETNVNVAMIVGSRFGEGPWLEWITANSDISPDDKDEDDNTLLHYVDEWNIMRAEELAASEIPDDKGTDEESSE